jgi:hypothetical protein
MEGRIQQVISFLESVGLSRKATDNADGFGSGAIRYQNGVSVRILNDRGDWFIEVSDSQRPNEWYDMALLREFLGESGSDVLDVPEQVAILTSRWDAIRSAFEPARAAESHRRLQLLREERAKRRFPAWYR